MDLKHLEQIVAISRHGGFSGAARRLGMAQSTLSKNIARLEAKLGVELFARDGGAAQPTSYGRFLVARAEAFDTAGLERLKAALVNQLTQSGLAAPSFENGGAGH